jgi:arylsulfatase A-like enzyme
MQGLRAVGLLAAAALVAASCSIGGPSSSAISPAPTQTSASTQRPNFLVIVADDLAYSDMGAFGGEIATPNLDRLSRSGVRLTNFYASPFCSPTRAMLMTGMDNHAVGVGQMAELLSPRQPAEYRMPAGRRGYEGYLRDDAVTIAERLKPLGYFTALSGKWHLGQEESQSPAAQGFDRSFVLLDGRQNHFGGDQTDAWKTYDAESSYREDGKAVLYPEGRYSSDVFTDRIIQYLDSAPPSQPYLAILGYTQPHWPLMAPAAAIARHKGRYDAGPAALAAARMSGMKAQGVWDVVGAPYAFSTLWDKQSPQERALSVRRMEIYAAMVEEMDRSIGRLMDHLQRTGKLDNTLIFFLSDNGADGNIMEQPIELRGRPGPLPPELRIDNSLDNLGSATSFTAYGPDWAQAGMAPFRRFKVTAWDGGYRSPAFITGAGVRATGIAPAVTHVTDIPTTIVSLASGSPPPVELHGKSLAPLMASATASVRGDEEPLFLEQGYSRAVFRSIRVKPRMWPPAIRSS